MAFKTLVILFLIGRITTQVSPSNVTGSHVTLPDGPESRMFGNVTTNGSDFSDSEFPDGQEDNVASAADHARKSLEIIQFYVYQIYLPITLVLGTLTCLITILVLSKNVLRSSAAVYIRGVAAANLLSLVVHTIGNFDKYDIVSKNRYWRNFHSYYVCFIFALAHTGFAANSWTICAFAVERVMAIYKPLRAHVISSESRAKKVVICIFGASFLMNALRFFRYSIKIEIDPVTNETMHVWYYTALGVNKFYTNVQYFLSGITVVLLPILLLSVINVMIIIKLRRTDRTQLSLKEGMGDSVDSKTGQIERVLIASMSAFLICNILSATIYITVAFRGLDIFRRYIFEFRVRLLISSMLNAVNPSLNFILYVYCSQTLRDAVKNLLRITACCSEKRRSKTWSENTNGMDSCSPVPKTSVRGSE